MRRLLGSLLLLGGLFSIAPQVDAAQNTNTMVVNVARKTVVTHRHYRVRRGRRGRRVMVHRHVIIHHR